MFGSIVRKQDNQFVISIPKLLVQQLELQEGQFARMHLEPDNDVGIMSPELTRVMEQMWNDHEDAFIEVFWNESEP